MFFPFVHLGCTLSFSVFCLLNIPFYFFFQNIYKMEYVVSPSLQGACSLVEWYIQVKLIDKIMTGCAKDREESKQLMDGEDHARELPHIWVWAETQMDKWEGNWEKPRLVECLSLSQTYFYGLLSLQSCLWLPSYLLIEPADLWAFVFYQHTMLYRFTHPHPLHLYIILTYKLLKTLFSKFFIFISLCLDMIE